VSGIARGFGYRIQKLLYSCRTARPTALAAVIPVQARPRPISCGGSKERSSESRGDHAPLVICRERASPIDVSPCLTCRSALTSGQPAQGRVLEVEQALEEK